MKHRWKWVRHRLIQADWFFRKNDWNFEFFRWQFKQLLIISSLTPLRRKKALEHSFWYEAEVRGYTVTLIGAALVRVIGWANSGGSWKSAAGWLSAQRRPCFSRSILGSEQADMRVATTWDSAVAVMDKMDNTYWAFTKCWSFPY